MEVIHQCLTIIVTHADYVGRHGEDFRVRLFVRSITQKRILPKCSNLVQGMTLGYPRSGTALGFKGQ